MTKTFFSSLSTLLIVFETTTVFLFTFYWHVNWKRFLFGYRVPTIGKSREFCKGISPPGKSREFCKGNSPSGKSREKCMLV